MSDHSGFSPEWQEIYRKGAHQSVWPWTDLVTLVMRHTPPGRAGLRVLELGVGAGANVSFFQSLGVDYRGVEGSPTAVDQLRRRFPAISSRFIVGDFTRELPPGPFDLIVDRGSLTHNSETAIRRSLALIRDSLAPTGHFIGIDWFSSAHSSATLGKSGEDSRTRIDIQNGHLASTGRVHFADEAHLVDLFRSFVIKFLRHKVTSTIVPAGAEQLALYDIVCTVR